MALTGDIGSGDDQSVVDRALLAPDYGCHLSLVRIVSLTIISYGLYALYWTYVTWKHYRDHTGETAYPVWHALAQLVPIYGWFRFYAHVIGYRDLMERQSMRNSLRVRPIMGIAVWVTLLGLVSATTTFSTLVLDSIRIVIALSVLCWIQFNINRYWASLESVERWQDKDYVLSRRARIGKGEILVTTIGAIVWTLTILEYLDVPKSTWEWSINFG